MCPLPPLDPLVPYDCNVLSTGPFVCVCAFVSVFRISRVSRTSGTFGENDEDTRGKYGKMSI